MDRLLIIFLFAEKVLKKYDRTHHSHWIQGRIEMEGGGRAGVVCHGKIWSISAFWHLLGGGST